VLQRLFTRIIMRVKVVCALAQEPPAQRLRVNAERSEPKGSVYAEWRRW
jgi:hypothetical protein